MKQLSLFCAGLKGSKVYYWTVEQIETVTHIVMVLQETYLLNAILCHNISVTIHTIQYRGTAKEPNDASH